MSTDCVFSGEKGNYLESDFPDGKTFYDRTKALGELNDDKNITLRNSIVGPDIKASGIGLLSWFMKQSGTINGFTKANVDRTDNCSTGKNNGVCSERTHGRLI